MKQIRKRATGLVIHGKVSMDSKLLRLKNILLGNNGESLTTEAGKMVGGLALCALAVAAILALYGDEIIPGMKNVITKMFNIS